MNLTATDVIELSRRQDGYLVQLDAGIVELREAGLITTTYAGDGFVIARAAPAPAAGRCSSSYHRPRRHPVGSFPKTSVAQ